MQTFLITLPKYWWWKILLVGKCNFQVLIWLEKQCNDWWWKLSQSARDRMFLSWETFEGLQITVWSVVECVKYLLNSGLKFVLIEKFNQDVVDEYFNRKRGSGRRNDNPTLLEFGYNANTIRVQRSVVTPAGNMRGAHKQERKSSWHLVDNTPLAILFFFILVLSLHLTCSKSVQ